MKFFQNVHGSEESAQPLIVGKDTIYVHTNIRQEQIEDLDGEMRVEWVYDEYQVSYTKDTISEAMLQVSSIQSEINIAKSKLLEAQIIALTERGEFMEDCFAELAVMLLG